MEIDDAISDMIDQEMGFTRVIEMIIDAKKPLIGHNMMFDLCFIYHQFVEDLPRTFKDFTKGWNSNLPEIYDTKVVSEVTNHFSKTEL